MKDEKTGDDLVSIGFVVDLNYRDATTSAHDLLQQFKLHPLVKGILEGGERVAWGAKALPGGGYWSMPKLSMPGAVLVGDAGGMVDTAALKGVHHCIKSGMLAAEAIYESLKNGETLESYERAVDESSIGKELYQVRNTRQAFQKGLRRGQPAGRAVDHVQGQGSARPPGVAPRRRRAAVRGRHPRGLPQARRQVHLRQARRRSTSAATPPATTPPTTSAFTATCRVRSPRGGATCARPASTRSPTTRRAKGPVDVIVNYTNCVQCGAITAKGGRLTAPEGGDGPLYQIT